MFTHTADIPAAAEHVWAVYSEVELWPHHMESMSHVDIIDGGPLRTGSKVWIKQPKLAAATWEVTELTPGRSWTWVSRSPGVRVTATHELTPVTAGATRVETSLEFGGPAGVIARALFGKRAQEYMALEADGLREACTTSAG